MRMKRPNIKYKRKNLEGKSYDLEDNETGYSITCRPATRRDYDNSLIDKPANFVFYVFRYGCSVLPNMSANNEKDAKAFARMHYYYHMIRMGDQEE